MFKNSQLFSQQVIFMLHHLSFTFSKFYAEQCDIENKFGLSSKQNTTST